MSGEKQQVGRLALRVEGDWWVAYFAKPATMEGAIELARIAMRLVQDRARKEAFMALMRDAVDEFLQDIYGERGDWHTRGAPEHERSGRA